MFTYVFSNLLTIQVFNCGASSSENSIVTSGKDIVRIVSEAGVELCREVDEARNYLKLPGASSRHSRLRTWKG